MEYRSLKSCFHDPKTDEKDEYKKRFFHPSSVALDFQIHGHTAFFMVNDEVLSLCSRILKRNEKLKELKAATPFFDCLFLDSVLQETVMSNKIEGISVSKETLLENMNHGFQGTFAHQVQGYLLMAENRIPAPESSMEIRDLYDWLLLDDIRVLESESTPDGKTF